MQNEKMIKRQKLINIALYVNVVLILVIGILFMISNISFQDEQRRLTKDEAQFVGLSIEQCEAIVGETLIDYGSEAYFDGGCEWELELGTLLCYREYRLRVFLDEEGLVRSVREEKTLDLIL